MFALGAETLTGLIMWYADRCHVRDRQSVTILSDDEVRTAILHARQDLKLVAFLLAGILIMLGVIADRIH
jgi:hypothetical protein